MSRTPYVMLSQGHVERSDGAIVLNMDILFENPSVTPPGDVKKIEQQLIRLQSEGEPVDRWISVCQEWLEEHYDANPEPSE